LVGEVARPEPTGPLAPASRRGRLEGSVRRVRASARRLAATGNPRRRPRRIHHRLHPGRQSRAAMTDSPTSMSSSTLQSHHPYGRPSAPDRSRTRLATGARGGQRERLLVPGGIRSTWRQTEDMSPRRGYRCLHRR